MADVFKLEWQDATMKTGWWFRPFLKSIFETGASVLVEFPWSDGFDLYATEMEARIAAREFFSEQRQQAILDIASLEKPYVAPNGDTYICPAHLMEKWRQEARMELKMAEAVLKLLA